MSNPTKLSFLSTKRALLLILLLAAVLRICGLSQESLWLDEGFTARRAGSTFLEISHEFRHQTQSALYYVGMKYWCAMFGRSDFALRFPSVFFGTATVLVIYLFARQLFPEKIALWSAFLLAVNPFAVFYSQEARPYALLMLSVSLSLYFLLLLRWKNSPIWILGYLLATLIALYSHPIVPLLLGLELFAVYLFWKSTDDQTPLTAIRYPLLAIGIAGLLYLPQVFFMWQTMATKIQGVGSGDWIPRPGALALVNTLRQYFMSLPLMGVAGLTILGAMMVKPRWDGKTGRGVVLLLALSACFLGGPWIVSRTITPVYVDRYTIPALLAVMILLAWAISKVGPWPRTLAVVIFLGLTTHTLWGYYSGADKDPFREAAAVVRSQVQSGDVVFVHASYARDVFDYYFHAPHGVKVVSPLPNQEIPADLDSANRIFVIRSYTLQTHASSDSLLTRITANYIAGKTEEIRGWADRNPGAYWIADISVTPYFATTTDRTNGSRQ